MNATPSPQPPQDHAPPGVGMEPATTVEPLEIRTPRQKLLFALKAIEIRLRFVAVLVLLGLVIGYWDTIQNYWDKWTRPVAAKLEPTIEYFCPMHPEVVRDTPNPDGSVPECPICHMPLSKRKKGQAQQLPEGVLSRVQLTRDRIQLGGIRTVKIAHRPLRIELRTIGFVDFDESRLSRIVPRVGGYVEKLYVNKSFSNVKEGEPLADLYSPELYTIVQELLIAQQSRYPDLVELGRKKLRLLGIEPQDIDAALKRGEAEHRLTLRSPRNGHLIRKDVVEGERVEPGKMLFEVADLSVVWIEGEVYEKDIATLRPGQQVEASVESYPNRTFHGRVSLIHPHLEPATRTLRVRFEVDNPDHLLRPGMYATVRIVVPIGTIEPFRQTSPGADDKKGVLAIPESAVIDTGRTKVVYVARNDPRADQVVFEGVEVHLGPRAGGYYAVVDGLSEGDEVAAAGAFLVDAETRLNPAVAGAYFGAGGGHDEPATVTSTSATNTAAADKSPKTRRGPTAEERANIDKLPPEDRDAALKQGLCPISNEPLGSMGVPLKLKLDHRDVYLCCKGCETAAEKEPEKTLKKVEKLIAEGQPSDAAQGDSRP